MGPLTNITYYIPHIIQILHKICLSCHYQNWVTDYTIPTQSSTSFGLWAKLTDSPKSKSLTTMWLIPKFYYDVANSKVRYDAALFTKLVATRQYFTKSQNHFYKAQIPIWHLFQQDPKSNLALLYKAQNIILATIFTLFHKAQILIWQLPQQLFYKAQIII